MNNNQSVDILELFNPDIVNEEQLNIEDYDFVYDTKDNELVGHMEKDFVRVDSKAIQEFINELQLNNNCSYVSYANDVIKEGIVPKKLSVLIKKGKGNRKRQQINSGSYSLEFRESISSKLLNFLECPVCYNFVVKGKDEVYVASVDFISENERFYSFEDFDMKWSYNLNNMVKSINEILDQFEFKSPEEKMKNKQNIYNDLMYTLLVREALLADGDLHTGNFGFLYNEKEKTARFVNFDMEFMFLSSNYLTSFRGTIAKIRKQNPFVYEKFMDKVRYIVDSFDKEKLNEIKDYNKFLMYRTLIERAKALIRYDRHFKNQEKVKEFLGLDKKKDTQNVK